MLPLYFKVVAVCICLEHKLVSNFWCVCKTSLVPSGLSLLNLITFRLKHSLSVQYLKSIFMDGDLWQLLLEVDSVYQLHLKVTFNLSIIYCFLNWGDFPSQISSVAFELENKLRTLLPNFLKCSEDKCIRKLLCSSVCLMILFQWRQLHTWWKNMIFESEIGLFLWSASGQFVLFPFFNAPFYVLHLLIL